MAERLVDDAPTLRRASFHGGPLDGERRLVPRHSPAFVSYRGDLWTTSKRAPTIYRWVPRMDLAVDSRQVRHHVELLCPDGQGLLELRYGDPPNRRQWFRRLGEKPWSEKLFQRARELADRDIYIGAAVRAYEGGDKPAVLHGWALWADADSAESQKALARFKPRPTMTTCSGGGRHGWWRLDRPLPGLALEPPLRQLGTAIGGDLSVAECARVMRLAGAFSFKYGEPRRIEILDHDPGRIYTLEQVLAGAASSAETFVVAPSKALQQQRSRAGNAPPPAGFDVQPNHGEGRRHTTLRSWIGKLVSHFPAADPEWLLAASHGLNERRLNPPKPEREVEDLVKWTLERHWGLRG